MDEEEKDHVQAVNYALHFGRNIEIYTKMELLISVENMPTKEFDGKPPNLQAFFWLDDAILQIKDGRDVVKEGMYTVDASRSKAKSKSKSMYEDEDEED